MSESKIDKRLMRLLSSGLCPHEDPAKFYVYTFNRWEDNSNENPRTLSLNTDKTITAYYKVKVIYIQSSLDNEVP